MCQKGFSLIEVLVSLVLMTTFGLVLLEQQIHSKQFIAQLSLRARGSQFLDQIDEFLFVGIDALPIVPEPYHFSIQKRKSIIKLQLSWFKDLGSISRQQGL